MESRVEGGLTGVFWNQCKISFYFVQFLHSEVAWEAQSSILSVKLYMNIRGTTPQKCACHIISAYKLQAVTTRGHTEASHASLEELPFTNGLPRGHTPNVAHCASPHSRVLKPGAQCAFGN